MRTADKLQQEFEKIFSGEPWYGYPIYQVIESVTFETAFEKPQRATHNIAEILLHMLTWTQEVSSRMQGNAAGMPQGGNWPAAGELDEQKWQKWVNDLKLANLILIDIIQKFSDNNWDNLINDTRESEPITTYEGLIYGFIQHQVYHAGQIAILKRIING